MNACLHTYCIDTRAATALPESFFASLSDTERRRVGELRRPQDSLNRKVAYAALCWLASRHSGLAPRHIQIRRDPHGKPSLRLPDGCPPLYTSLAHSGHFVLLTLASCPVGIDLEGIRPIDFRPLKQVYFPRDRLSADDPNATLFAWWTVKEAALKAIGKGLSVDPALIVARVPERYFQPLDDYPPGHGLEAVRVACLAPPAGYVAAIAALHPNPCVEMFQLNTDQLLEIAKC